MPDRLGKRVYLVGRDGSEIEWTEPPDQLPAWIKFPNGKMAELEPLDTPPRPDGAWQYVEAE